MLTIQPNFTKSMHSVTSFGHTNPNYTDDLDDAYETDLLSEDAENDEFVSREDSVNDDEPSEKEKTLAGMRNDINETMSNIKDIEQELPPALRKGIGWMFTLGAAAVAGISTKFGVSETSKAIGKLSKKESVKAATSNLKGSLTKLGKSIGKCFDAIKNTKVVKSLSDKFGKAVEKFNKTKFGKKISAFFEKLTNNKFANKIKGIFGAAKKVDGKKVVDRTGDVIGAATGVSTAAVGIVDPEQKAKVEG